MLYLQATQEGRLHVAGAAEILANKRLQRRQRVELPSLNLEIVMGENALHGVSEKDIVVVSIIGSEPLVKSEAHVGYDGIEGGLPLVKPLAEFLHVLVMASSNRCHEHLPLAIEMPQNRVHRTASRLGNMFKDKYVAIAILSVMLCRCHSTGSLRRLTIVSLVCTSKRCAFSFNQTGPASQAVPR